MLQNIENSDHNYKYFKYKSKYILQKELKGGIQNILIKNKGKLNKYVNNVNQSYKIFKLKYTDNDYKIIKNFIIEKNSSYNYYGLIDKKILTDQIKLFLLENDKNSINNCKKITNLLYALIKEVTIDVYGKNFAWITIRIMIPDEDDENNFLIPRFHIDGKFFNINDKNNNGQTKFITTLKGAGTIFVDANKQIRDIYYDFRDKNINKDKDMEYRLKLMNLLENAKKINLKNNEGAIFKSFDRNLAAIHSEPYITEPRIFLSILPGNKEEINELYERWKKK